MLPISTTSAMKARKVFRPLTVASWSGWRLLKPIKIRATFFTSTKTSNRAAETLRLPAKCHCCPWLPGRTHLTLEGAQTAQVGVIACLQQLTWFACGCCDFPLCRYLVGANK